ncbi:hypothetical protein EMCRGX_G030114 [Ephydatia muelleri]
MEMCAREKEFGIFLSEKFSSTNRGTNGVFYKDFRDNIKAAKKDPSSVDKNLRFFVKKSGFQILNIPSLGARDVLVVPAKQQGLEDNTALDNRVTGSSIEVTETPCHIDFNAWSKFCDDIDGSKELKDQLISSPILRLWQSGSRMMYNSSCREDKEIDLSEYLHDPTEYGLHINTHVSLWLHSRSYDNKPLLVQAFGFVIVTEEIHEEFDAFVASMPLLTQGCYLQCGPLLQYWNMHMRPTPASVVNLFTNEYLYFHYSDVDNLGS